MTELVVHPCELRNIDLITSTHNHTDHLDAETLCPLLASNPQTSLVIPKANHDFVSQRLDCHRNWPLGILDGESLQVGDLTVHAVPAAHNEIERDTQGRSKFLGYVLQCGEMTVYHSGDTLHYHGMEDHLR